MCVILPITNNTTIREASLTITTIITMMLLSKPFLFALHKTYCIFHFEIHLLLWVLCSKSICTNTSNGIIVSSCSSSSSFVCGQDTQQDNFFLQMYINPNTKMVYRNVYFIHFISACIHFIYFSSLPQKINLFWFFSCVWLFGVRLICF